MKIEIYTDGSATTADKPGGWAYVMVVDGHKYAECSGYMPNATNNDAEMEAAIEGLDSIQSVLMVYPNPIDFPIEVELVSDSQLILGWASGVYRFKQPTKIAKYEQLRALAVKYNIKTRWVEGHSGDEHNERCDKLANEARRSLTKKVDGEDVKLAGKTLIGTKKSGTVCIWYKDKLKVVDLETNVIENYDRSLHGSRGSILQVREEKSR